jgi:Cu2+-exporting ATPase
MTNPNDQCCCHCGQPHKEGVSYSIIIAGKEQTMCCPGCQAVASLIADGKKENNGVKRDRN